MKIYREIHKGDLNLWASAYWSESVLESIRHDNRPTGYLKPVVCNEPCVY